VTVVVIVCSDCFKIRYSDWI